MKQGIRGIVGSDAALILLTVLVLAGMLFLHGACIGRYPAAGGDETPISATGYSLWTKGSFGCPIFNSHAGIQTIYYYPPVASLLMAFSYLLFGFGVLQTRLPSLVLGVCASLVLFFVARRICNDLRASVIAFLLFILNGEIFFSWQSGRPEAAFLVCMSAILYLLFLGYSADKKFLAPLWFLIGVLTGVAGLTYYPFALSVGLCVFFALRWFLAQRQDLAFWQKAKVCGFFICGGGIIASLLVFFIRINPEYFRLQVLDELWRYFSFPKISGKHLWVSITEELSRYLQYSFRRFGMAEPVLAFFAFVGVFFISRKKPMLRILWWAAVVWVGTFFLFAIKSTTYLPMIVPFSVLAVAVVYQQARQSAPTLPRLFFRILVWITLGAGVFRMLLIGYTLAYQWQGRDYAAFSRRLQEIVPAGAFVVGPQLAWYALESHVGHMQLYNQVPGVDKYDPSGIMELNRPKVLANVDYIILKRDVGLELGLSGMIRYMDRYFRLQEKIRMPFRPLPWAKLSPYDVEVYVKK